jgi:hypothetical protein
MGGYSEQGYPPATVTARKNEARIVRATVPSELRQTDNRSSGVSSNRLGRQKIAAEKTQAETGTRGQRTGVLAPVRTRAQTTSRSSKTVLNVESQILATESSSGCSAIQALARAVAASRRDSFEARGVGVDTPY